MEALTGMAADDTVLDRLVAELRQRGQGVDGQEAPAAVLWPDPRGEWRPLVGLLRERMPELLVLGEYDPANRAGPAIWLRVVLEGDDGPGDSSKAVQADADASLDGPPGPAGARPSCRRDTSMSGPAAEAGSGAADAATPPARPPVLYLPDVSRQQLRAGHDCPDELKPLVELLYRGAVWVHPNGKEWTARAFLRSPKLRLDVAEDGASRQEMSLALKDLAVQPSARLRGKRLDAGFFRSLLVRDLRRDVLDWMVAPGTLQARLGPDAWQAFCGRCKDELGFGPETAPDVLAGELLGKGEGDWQHVWERFAEAPGAWPGVVDVLRRSRPTDEVPFRPERWPDLNDEAEETLRRRLGEVAAMSQADACGFLDELEGAHNARRNWVWVRLGQCRMAEVLEPLARLAAGVRTTLGGSTTGEAAVAYLKHGWMVDAAARQALERAPHADGPLVAGVVRRLLLPWLDDSAQAFQAAVRASPLPVHGEQETVEAEEGECLLFVDGLRYELGVALAELLEGRGLHVDLRRRWAASPTVTATGKPAVAPVAGEVGGDSLGGDFAPGFGSAGPRVDAQGLRRAIEKAGYQTLAPGSLDLPFGESPRGWAETGAIDKLGHDLDAVEFARSLPEELKALTERIAGLLGGCWRRVRVVTDHGWLMMPEGLPKVDLPQHLAVSRGARCAVVSGESRPDALMAPWYWNPRESFVAPGGAAAFRRGVEYGHGGLSLQECLIPDLVVTRAEAERAVQARIRTVTWRGFRCNVECRVEAGPAHVPVEADLRLRDDLVLSVAGTRKRLDADGSVSLLLGDDDHEESRLVLVLVDREERILDRRETGVGENS